MPGHGEREDKQRDDAPVLVGPQDEELETEPVVLPPAQTNADVAGAAEAARAARSRRDRADEQEPERKRREFTGAAGTEDPDADDDDPVAEQGEPAIAAAPAPVRTLPPAAGSWSAPREGEDG